MPILPEDMLDPRGPILPSWFPKEGGGYEDNLEDRLWIYIQEAEGKPELLNADDQDAAVKRWVEYRVYSALNARSASMAGVQSMTLNDQGSFTMAAGEQAASWAKSAQGALQAWRLLTAPPEIARTADGQHAREMWPQSEHGESS